jgi:hypothetical protein
MIAQSSFVAVASGNLEFWAPLTRPVDAVAQHQQS